MDKNLFFEAIKTKVLNTLQEDIPSLTATLTTVTKTNNTLYHALSFRSDTNNIQPVIYLDGYYEQFSNDKITLEDATSLIISLYKDSILPEVNVNFMQDFESIKNKVIPCIFNTASNTSMLQDLVHKDFLDLSICYLVLVDLPDRINGSVKVTNKLLETWDISEDTLDKAAWDNLHASAPYTLERMFDMLTRLTNYSEPIPESDFTDNMMILSSKLQNNGAIYMCDTDVLSEIASRISDNLIILPSSRHEVILLPYSMIQTPDNLHTFKNIVDSVNNDVLSPEDYLSGSVYIFDRESKTTSIAS